MQTAEPNRESHPLRTTPEFRERHLGQTAPRHPLASPLFDDYRGLPPLLIQLGEHEVLRDDAIWPGMVLVFPIRGIPESRELSGGLASS